MSHMREVWEASRRNPDDPGLRDSYSQIPRLPIRLICCKLDKEINHGNLLRIAEAFRLEMVQFAPRPDRDFSGAMGGHVWQPYEWVEPESAISAAKKDGNTLYALDIADDAVDVHTIEWRFPAALLIGEELTGIPKEHSEACDFHVAIPLYGLMQSLNVAVATGICLDQMVAAAARIDPAYRPVRGISQRLLGDI